MKPTIGSLFSGIGGLDLAAHWAGFDTKWFVEKEPFCQKVLNKHWPNIPVYDDIFTCTYPPYVDVLVGGFPCQPFSVAGAQRGRDDERFLLPEMLRIVREVQPYAVLFENVPGFPSLNDGREFKYLLGALAEMGFDAEWGHIRASDIGAPHTRERWFCVAYAVSNRVSSPIRTNESRNRKTENTSRRQFDNTDNSSRTELAYPEHDGYLAATFTGSHETAVRNIAQRSVPSGKPARSDSPRIATGSTLGNTTGAGLEGANGHQSPFSERTRPGTRWQTEPRIRGTLNGLPRRLDFVGFPARPGQPQYAYEPPRTAPSTPTTNARIKALGNAVVPAVAYPIFQAIAEWLEGQGK